jgi:glycine dehydrogenase
MPEPAEKIGYHHGSDFARRHIGPNPAEVDEMLRAVGYDRLDAMIDATVPKNIRMSGELKLPAAKSEAEAMAELRGISRRNAVLKSFIGAGDPAQHPGKPWLVHRLHAVSG